MANYREEVEIYHITVIGIKRRPIVLDFETSEPEFKNKTIGELKHKLKDRLPGGLNDVRLTFADVQLEDGDTFEKHKITHNSRLQAIPRMPGGGSER